MPTRPAKPYFTIGTLMSMAHVRDLDAVLLAEFRRLASAEPKEELEGRVLTLDVGEACTLKSHGWAGPDLRTSTLRAARRSPAALRPTGAAEARAYGRTLGRFADELELFEGREGVAP